MSDKEKQPYRVKHKKCYDEIFGRATWRKITSPIICHPDLQQIQLLNGRSFHHIFQLSSSLVSCSIYVITLLKQPISVRTYELLHKVSLVKLVKFITIIEITVFLSSTLLLVLRLFPRLLLTILQMILLDEDIKQVFHLPDTGFFFSLNMVNYCCNISRVSWV